MNARNFVAYISVALIIVISILIFYEIAVSEKSGLGIFYDGIIAIIFAIISYLIHSVLNARRVITSFSYGYYLLSIVFLAIYIYQFNLKIYNIIYLLVYVLISLPLIYWRLTLTQKEKIKSTQKVNN